MSFLLNSWLVIIIIAVVWIVLLIRAWDRHAACGVGTVRIFVASKPGYRAEDSKSPIAPTSMFLALLVQLGQGFIAHLRISSDLRDISSKRGTIAVAFDSNAARDDASSNDDLTGNFCASREERPEYRKEPVGHKFAIKAASRVGTLEPIFASIEQAC